MGNAFADSPLALRPTLIGSNSIYPPHLREFEGQDVLDELTFILLPSVRIHWPDKLLHQNESTQIHIEDSEGLTFNLEHCERAHPDQQRWSVPPGVTLVEGSLSCDEITVNIAHRLYRASLKKQQTPEVTLLSDGDFMQSTGLVLSSLPEQPATLYLSGTHQHELSTIEGVNQAGEKTFPSFELRDALFDSLCKNPDLLGEFHVHVRGGSQGTGTYFLHIEAIKNKLHSADADLSLTVPDNMD